MTEILVLYYSAGGSVRRMAELNATRTGGTPYGASHFAGIADDLPISDAERALCVAQGRRLAEVALKLGVR